MSPTLAATSSPKSTELDSPERLLLIPGAVASDAPPPAAANGSDNNAVTAINAVTSITALPLAETAGPEVRACELPALASSCCSSIGDLVAGEPGPWRGGVVVAEPVGRDEPTLAAAELARAVRPAAAHL